MYNLREDLARLSHDDIWSTWMDYMFNCGTTHIKNIDGVAQMVWEMPNDKYMRWQRQMQTPYDELTEREKESDREQADKIIDVLSKNGIIMYKAELQEIEPHTEGTF